MTNGQERAIERLRKLVDEACKTLGKEVKKFEVEDCDFFVDVYVVLGHENDEGTFRHLARDYAQVFVGKRGGIRFPVNGKNGQYCLPFKWNFFEVLSKQGRKYFH